MWNNRDWIFLGVSAASAFGITLAAFYPSSATADNPLPIAVVIDNPTLTIDGVSITANTDAGAKDTKSINAVTIIEAGALPKMQLRASNKSDSKKSVQFSGIILESAVPNLDSRVPLPKTAPKEEWTQKFDFDLEPGASKLIEISPDVKLSAMSSATLELDAGTQKIDALTISTNAGPAWRTLKISPTTAPSSITQAVGFKTVQ